MTLVVPPDAEPTEAVHRGRGRRSKLTPACHRGIVDAMAVGARIGVAARRARVADRTSMRWLARGVQAEEYLLTALEGLGEAELDRIDALSDDRPKVTDRELTPMSPRERALAALLPPKEVIYWHFATDVAKATADFELRNLTVVQEFASGFDSTEETTVDEFGPKGELVRRVTTRKVKPVQSWQAGMTLLERRFPDLYAQVSRTQVTGAYGGPLEHEVSGPDGGPMQVLARMEPDDRDDRTAGILAILIEAGALPCPEGVALDVGAGAPRWDGDALDAEDDELYPPRPD